MNETKGVALFFAIIIAVAIVVVSIAINYTYKSDDKAWNNGFCNECGERYEYSEAVGHRSGTTYIYKCGGCGHRIELYGLK